MIEFLIISDAAGKACVKSYRPGSTALLRVNTYIMMERIINHKDAGAFLQTGHSFGEILTQAGRGQEIPDICPQCLSYEKATRAANAPMMIGLVAPDDFELLFRHGSEVADYSVYAFYADQFKYIGYANSPWGRKNQATHA